MINKIESPKVTKKSPPVTNEATKKENQKWRDFNPLLLAFIEIYQTVQVVHQTANIHTKELQANASAQDVLISEEANFNFELFTKGMEKRITIQAAQKGKAEAAGIGIGVAVGAVVNGIAGIFCPGAGGAAGAYAGEAVYKAFEDNKDIKKWRDGEYKMGFTNLTITKVSSFNQETSAERNYFSSELNQKNQQSGIDEARISSDVSLSNQGVAAAGKLLNMLTTLSEAINR